MTKSELNKYRNVLEAKQAELVQLVRNRDGIAIEKCPEALDEVQLGLWKHSYKGTEKEKSEMITETQETHQSADPLHD